MSLWKHISPEASTGLLAATVFLAGPGELMVTLITLHWWVACHRLESTLPLCGVHVCAVISRLMNLKELTLWIFRQI